MIKLMDEVFEIFEVLYITSKSEKKFFGDLYRSISVILNVLDGFPENESSRFPSHLTSCLN